MRVILTCFCFVYRWAQSQSSNIAYGNNYVTTPRNYYYTTTPYNYYSTPAISGSIKGGSSSSNYYYAGSSSSSSGYGSQNLARLQRQLQSDLSRDLHGAINRDYSLYSNSGGSNSQAYQTSLRHLSDELNRNLTRRVQEYSAGGSYSASGHFDQAEMDRLQNKLQNDLMRELEQNLQQQYSSSSSYSASSSSSSSGHYRPTRGYQSNQLGQYRSDHTLMEGEDCDHDDLSAYRNYRMKRSYGTYGRQNQQTQYGKLQDFHGGQQEIETIGQEVDDSDLTQQTEDVEFGNLQNSYKPQTNPMKFGQQVDDSDTQQVEHEEFGHFQVGQQVDDSDHYTNYGKPNTGNQLQVGQQIDDTDLTQETEDLEFGKPILQNSRSYGQIPKVRFQTI